MMAAKILWMHVCSKFYLHVPGASSYIWQRNAHFTDPSKGKQSWIDQTFAYSDSNSLNIQSQPRVQRPPFLPVKTPMSHDVRKSATPINFFHITHQRHAFVLLSQSVFSCLFAQTPRVVPGNQGGGFHNPIGSVPDMDWRGGGCKMPM